MPPGNDNLIDAIPLESEFGNIAGTTRGASGETRPPPLYDAVITNGHDVWYAWNVVYLLGCFYYGIPNESRTPFAWVPLGVRVVGPIRYEVTTSGTNFRHVLRVYVKVTDTKRKMIASRGPTTPGRGLDQVLDFDQDGTLFSDLLNPDGSYNPAQQYVYIQVDSSEPNGEMGDFTLNWGRSSVPSLGAIESFPAFRDDVGHVSAYIGNIKLRQVDAANVLWFANGQNFEEGDYLFRYGTGFANLLTSTDPSSLTGGYHDDIPLLDGRVDLLFNSSPFGGQSGTVWAPGPIFEQLVNARGAGVLLADGHIAIPFGSGVTARMAGRFVVLFFHHYGGPIGIQFRDFYDACIWAFPTSLPPTDPGTFLIEKDFTYLDNTLLDPPPTYHLWRMLTQPVFTLADFQNIALIGFAYRSVSVWIHNVTQTPFKAVRVRLQPNLIYPGQDYTQDFDAGDIIPFIFTWVNVVQKVRIDLSIYASAPPFSILMDFTPSVQLAADRFIAILPNGKWSIGVKISNSGFGTWGSAPILTMTTGDGTQIEYPNGQALAYDYSNEIIINFLPRPGVRVADLFFRVTDYGKHWPAAGPLETHLGPP